MVNPADAEETQHNAPELQQQQPLQMSTAKAASESSAPPTTHAEEDHPVPSTDSASDAAAGGATNMSSHAPFRMKLGNRKSRKRKIRPQMRGGPVRDGVLGSESSEDEDDESVSKTPRQELGGIGDTSEAGEHASTSAMAEGKQPAVDLGSSAIGNADNSSGSSPGREGNQSIHPGARSIDGSVNSTAAASAEATANQQGPSHVTAMPSQEPQNQQSNQQQQHHHTHQHQHTHRPNADQPEGWRVKLYRLNMDGSWDDCGTGRIVCLYRSQQEENSSDAGKQNPHESENHNPNDHPHRTSQPPQHHEPPQNSRPGPNQTTDQWLFQETGEATLCVQAELGKSNRQQRVLLRTRILLRDAYQRQGDNIITWCEPFYGQRNGPDDNEMPTSTNGNNNGNNLLQQQGGGVDLALSFQDNAGCLDIWRQITHVQSRANDLLRSLPNEENHSVQRMAAAIAAQHAAHLQQRGDDGHGHQADVVVWGGGHMNDDGSPGQGDYGMLDSPVHLPDPPTLANLEQIADSIAAIHNVQQRENMAIVIAKDECAYLRALLALFPAAEERNDYGKLATLAACVKTILLLNEPSILELIVAVAEMFEQVCSCLEYDPDLREKANHRWFLRERAKFRTVVAMDNMELVAAIHRSFRVNYLRDTLLRPTMDESSLSTLSSLQTFSHADVVKGVTMSPNGEEVSLTESYLVRVIRMLGIELHAIGVLEWQELDNPSGNSSRESSSQEDMLYEARDPSTVVREHPLSSATWKQYLAPQDNSLASRRLRRRGCLSFLKELFNMVRLSLQQTDKDDFFSVICTLDVDLIDDFSDNISQTSQIAEMGSVASTVKSEQHVEIPQASSPASLLSLLGNALADPNIDISEKDSVLEIIAGVAMHDPSFIRRHCLDHHNSRKEMEKEAVNDVPKVLAGRPDPNEKKQVIDISPPNDLLAALLFLLNVTTDAGVLLQATEIMRIILDTDIVGDNTSITAGFKDDAEGMPPGHPNGPHHDQHTQPSQAAVTTNDQKQFFSLFYEHYMEWLVAPFQFTLLHPTRRVPEHILKNPTESRTMQDILASWRAGVQPDDKFLQTVPFNAIRSSFAVELLSFCVRAHLYWMKFFLLKSRVLGNVLALLKPATNPREDSGDRCLKLAALRFLRSILSVHDEFYHRHIIQHDLFAPVFAALRENPVGDNLVSSAIVEMCDYIHNENIKSLIEYIVTKHLSQEDEENGVPRLEDVSSPYVTTLTVLREAYEANRNSNQPMDHMQGGLNAGQTSPGGSRYFPPSGSAPHHPVPRILSGKALEDQRKFQEADEEESYFESDNSGEDAKTNGPDSLLKPNPGAPGATAGGLAMPMAVDEVDAAGVANAGDSSELHRTPRMFSLAQTPLLNHLEDSPSSPSKIGAADTPESPPSIDAPSAEKSNAPKTENMKTD